MDDYDYEDEEFEDYDDDFEDEDIELVRKRNLFGIYFIKNKKSKNNAFKLIVHSTCL